MGKHHCIYHPDLFADRIRLPGLPVDRQLGPNCGRPASLGLDLYYANVEDQVIVEEVASIQEV